MRFGGADIANPCPASRDTGLCSTVVGRIRYRGRAGSGTAIGVAMMFPMLMLVIVLISVMANSSRVEQTIHSVANRAARAGSLCCEATAEAADVVEASLAAAVDAAAFNRVVCNNDLVADSRVVFLDVADNEVPVGDGSLVPPGGTVYVFLTCRVPPQALGGAGVPGLELERRAVGVASIDPYRFRPSA